MVLIYTIQPEGTLITSRHIAIVDEFLGSCVKTEIGKSLENSVLLIYGECKQPRTILKTVLKVDISFYAFQKIKYNQIT